MAPSSHASGWRVTVRCPHGVLVDAPVSVVRSLEPLIDPCPEARAERDAQDAAADLRRMGSWRGMRRARREARRAAVADFDDSP